jgi:hypothetical protein
VTVRPIATTADLDRANRELNAAVDRTGSTPECRLNWEFTDENQSLMTSLDLVSRCNSCPVLAECNALADLMPAHDKAGSVIAGVKYDGAGQAVDLWLIRERIYRDRRLAASVDLQGAA